jgi:hypothetical protein
MLGSLLGIAMMFGAGSSMYSGSGSRSSNPKPLHPRKREVDLDSVHDFLLERQEKTADLFQKPYFLIQGFKVHGTNLKTATKSIRKMLGFHFFNPHLTKENLEDIIQELMDNEKAKLYGNNKSN